MIRIEKDRGSSLAAHLLQLKALIPLRLVDYWSCDIMGLIPTQDKYLCDEYDYLLCLDVIYNNADIGYFSTYS